MLPPEPPGLALAPRHLAELRVLLQRHVPDAEVWAFGSRVGGGGHEGSDLDLVLRNVQDPAQPVVGGVALREALHNSALPMPVEVHDWALVPSAFHASTQQAQLVLQVPQPRTLPEAGQNKLGDTLLGEPAPARDWTSSEVEAASRTLQRGRWAWQPRVGIWVRRRWARRRPRAQNLTWQSG